VTGDPDVDGHCLIGEAENYWREYGVEEGASCVETLVAVFVLKCIPTDERSAFLRQLVENVADTVAEVESAGPLQ
jgi:hypothetical protein